MLSKISKEYIFPVVMLAVSALAGYYLANTGYESVKQMRQLERVPSSKVGALLPGEANVTAEVAVYRKTLSSFYTKTPSVYYRFIEEKQEVDTDGDSRWRTVNSKTESVDFYVKDDTGKALVNRSAADIDWSLTQSFQVVKGSRRFTEWRIEPGDTVFIFALAALIENQITLNFTYSGQYTPIISTYSEAEERSDMGAMSLIQVWSGITLLSLCVYFVAYVFKVHRLVAYLSILTMVLSILLIDMGLNMMRDDLLSGMKRYNIQNVAATERVAYLLQRDNIPFHGWHDLHDLRDSRYRHLGKISKKKVSEIRLNLMLARQQLVKPMQLAPTKWFVGMWGVIPPDVVPAPEKINKQLETRLKNYQPTELSKFWPGVFVIIGLFVTGLFSWLGIRLVKLKRYVENVPTSSSSGVAYGVSEVKGKLVLDKGSEALQSPLTHTQCAWYYYHVQEKRGSGKNEKWVTVQEVTETMSFLCEDNEGKIRIDANKAEVISGSNKVERRGSFKYTEKVLKTGDDLYVIGYANLGNMLSDDLLIGYSSEREPFIISNESEQQVMIKKARKGILSLNVAFSSAVLSALLLFGISGSFSPTDFLFSALMAPLFMILIMMILHYNDIVFLRQRVERNWSNIKVSLEKRYNLIPNIEQVVKDHAKHEAGLLESIVEYRSEFKEAMNNIDHFSRLIDKQGTLKLNISKLNESYPELKNNDLVMKMMDILSVLENELMFMRRGYNDAVEIYNTRIRSVPDIVFTGMFGFNEKEFIVI